MKTTAFVTAMLACSCACLAANFSGSSIGDAIADFPGDTLKMRPANKGDRMLTMKETILSRDLNPRTSFWKWERKGKGYEPVRAERRAPSEPSGLFAFTQDGGLYLHLNDSTTIPVALPESKDIVYGNYVSRNEFGIEDGIFWSPDSTKIAFYRKDESRVADFPLLDITAPQGVLKSIKYPMTGTPSEILRLCVYDIATADTLHIKADDFGADRYLTGITWAPDSRRIYIQVLDRSQKHLRLNMYDPSDGHLVRTLLTEDNDKYVEPLDPLYFLKGDSGRFLYRTANRDLWRNLYLCDTLGRISRLTEVDADVEYLGNDGRYVYYTSAEVSPVENHLFRQDVRTGRRTRLTKASGWHHISLSPDFRQFLDIWSNARTPYVTDLCSTDGKSRCNLERAEDPTSEYAYTAIILGKVRSADGKYDNYYRLVLPKDFDPQKKYPLIHYVYGGPHSQMVRDTWGAELRRWEMYMAQRGWIVYVQDNRGTQNRGLEFEQEIHGQCGQAEMADQIAGLGELLKEPWVDRERVGVHGWSYGGFMTISLLTNYPEIYKAGVAGGPVIDWKWYEVMYGERYMGTPQDNPEGYALTSLIPKAASLSRKLLICQGAVDPVVVWQNSLSFVQECISNNVQVDYFPYPVAEHNMFGMERVHLMDKVTEYFDTWVK